MLLSWGAGQKEREVERGSGGGWRGNGRTPPGKAPGEKMRGGWDHPKVGRGARGGGPWVLPATKIR